MTTEEGVVMEMTSEEYILKKLASFKERLFKELLNDVSEAEKGMIDALWSSSDDSEKLARILSLLKVFADAYDQGNFEPRYCVLVEAIMKLTKAMNPLLSEGGEETNQSLQKMSDLIWEYLRCLMKVVKKKPNIPVENPYKIKS